MKLMAIVAVVVGALSISAFLVTGALAEQGNGPQPSAQEWAEHPDTSWEYRCEENGQCRGVFEPLAPLAPNVEQEIEAGGDNCRVMSLTGGYHCLETFQEHEQG
jgi:hypothetical protein